MVSAARRWRRVVLSSLALETNSDGLQMLIFPEFSYYSELTNDYVCGCAIQEVTSRGKAGLPAPNAFRDAHLTPESTEIKRPDAGVYVLMDIEFNLQ